MPTNLAFPPARVPIGQFVDDQGRTVGVLMTPEFARALSSLLNRVGGPSSYGMDEVLEFAGSLDSSAAMVASLRGQVNDLTAQLAAANATNARLATLERKMEELAVLAHGARQAPVDWEHPGKIGYAAPNSAKVTTLVATGKTQLNPAGADVELKPTGAGTVTISPATAGTLDNVAVGAATPRAGAFTTLTATSNVGIGTAAPSGNFRMETPNTYTNAARLGQVSIGLAGTGYPQIGYNFRTTSVTDAYNYDVGDVSSVVRFNAGTVDFLRAAAGAAGGAIAYSSMGKFSASGLQVTSGFGCNGKGPQGPAASGGTLAGVIAALVANGILSS